MAGTRANSDRSNRNGNTQEVGRPRGSAWRPLYAEGIAWEGQVVIVGGEHDLAARLIVTRVRLALISGGDIALEIPRRWLEPDAKLVDEYTVVLSITPEGATAGSGDTDHLKLNVREDRDAAVTLLTTLTGRSTAASEATSAVTKRKDVESPVWNTKVGAAPAMALPPLPEFDDDLVMSPAKWPPTGSDAISPPTPRRTRSTGGAAKPQSESIADWAARNLDRRPLPPPAPVPVTVSRAATQLGTLGDGKTVSDLEVPIVPVAPRRDKLWLVRTLQVAILAILLGTGWYFGQDRFPGNFSVAEAVSDRIDRLIGEDGEVDDPEMSQINADDPSQQEVAVPSPTPTSTSTAIAGGDGTGGTGQDGSELGVGGPTRELPTNYVEDQEEATEETAEPTEVAPLNGGPVAFDEPAPANDPEPTTEPTDEPAPTETPEPTATEVPPTETPEPTATEVPPTETPEPTATEVPPTETPEPTATEVPPTETPEPTATEVPPTETPEPTATEVPPTETPEPTATEVPPTETPVPTIEPTAEFIPTETPVPTVEVLPTVEATETSATVTLEPTLEPQQASVDPSIAPAQETASGPFRLQVEGAAAGEDISTELPEVESVSYGEWVVLSVYAENLSSSEQVFDMSQFRLLADGEEVLLDTGNSWIGSLLGYTPAYGNTDTVLWAPAEGHRFALTFLVPVGSQSLVLQAGEQTIDLSNSLSANADLAQTGDEPAATDPYEAEVVEVIDGETIVIEKDGIRQTVKYLGIDAPTGADCYAAEATAANSELVAGQTVRLERQVTDTDAKGNWVRDVWVANDSGEYTLVANALVADGAIEAAISEPNTRFASWLTSSQATAEAAGAGMWTSCGASGDSSPDPTPVTDVSRVSDRRQSIAP